jgi:hypothetical protein
MWKKESAPCDSELSCLRAEQKWDPAAHAKAKAEEKEDRKREVEEERTTNKRKREKFVPKTNYQVEERESPTDKELSLIWKHLPNLNGFDLWCIREPLSILVIRY